MAFPTESVIEEGELIEQIGSLGGCSLGRVGVRSVQGQVSRATTESLSKGIEEDDGGRGAKGFSKS